MPQVEKIRPRNQQKHTQSVEMTVMTLFKTYARHSLAVLPQSADDWQKLFHNHAKKASMYNSVCRAKVH
jgi:hypothetical protein